MIEQEIRQNGEGEPVMVLTVTGGKEIFRLSHHLMQGQIEFGDLARDAFVWLRRRWGIRAFRQVDQEMTGGFVVKHGWHLPARGDL